MCVVCLLRFNYRTCASTTRQKKDETNTTPPAFSHDGSAPNVRTDLREQTFYSLWVSQNTLIKNASQFVFTSLHVQLQPVSVGWCGLDSPVDSPVDSPIGNPALVFGGVGVMKRT